MNQTWTKVLSFSLVLLLVHIADAIISFWAPNQIESALHNSVLVGLIISFQSIVGLSADLIFPKILKNVKVRRLIYLAIGCAGVTSLLLLSATVKPLIIVFLAVMAAWGMYYELMAFGTFQFVDNAVPAKDRSSAWSIMGIFKNLAYLVGPLLAAWLFLAGYIQTEAFIMALLILAGILLAFSKKSHDQSWDIDVTNLNPGLELKYWRTLIAHVWPIIIMTLIMGFIDATFWTTGVLWTTKLLKIDPLAGLFLPSYMLPPLFVGLVLAKMNIFKGKKIAAEKMVLAAGLLLGGLIFAHSTIWQLVIVLGASAALSIAYPLLDGVYSDIVARMGHEKKHLIGLTSSTVNIAYIIWPPIAGLITLKLGEQMTFAFTGVLVALVALILLFVTPKKLRLPQSEIKSWDAVS